VSYLLDALGLAGDTLDRPGAAVRGLLAGRPDQLYNLLPGSESMGLLDPGRKVSGRDLNRMYGLAGEEDTWSNYAGGLLTETFTDPARLFGMALGARRALGGGAPASRVGQLLDKRRGFGVVEVQPAVGGAKVVAPPHSVLGLPEQEHVGRVMARLAGEAEGAYFPTLNAGAVLKGTGPNVRRHEVVHGLIDQATKTGDTSGLPLVAKLPVWLAPKAGRDAPFRHTLAQVADELAAQALENKGLLEQLRGGARFLFANPLDGPQQAVRRAYFDAFQKRSPAAARLYELVGNAPLAVGAGAAGLGSLGLAGRLYQDYGGLLEE
jgi:hypothetical protein